MPLDDANWTKTRTRSETSLWLEEQEPATSKSEPSPARRTLMQGVSAALSDIWKTVVRLTERPPVDARIVLLRKARKMTRYSGANIVAFIRSQPASPAAINGALEAIRAASGHPVNADFRTSRYSCDTRCMTKATVRRHITTAIGILQQDHTRFVAS